MTLLTGTIWELCFKIKRYDEVIEHFNKAIKIKPKICLYCYNLGNTFTDLMRYDDAIEQYEKQYQLIPTCYYGHDYIVFYYGNRVSIKMLEHWEKKLVMLIEQYIHKKKLHTLIKKALFIILVFY